MSKLADLQAAGMIVAFHGGMTIRPLDRYTVQGAGGRPVSDAIGPVHRTRSVLPPVGGLAVDGFMAFGAKMQRGGR